MKLSMKLRTLKKEDAPFMLEWMHDDSIVKNLSADFSAKTLQDCLDFIEAAQNTSSNMHMAISVNDIYMGTVSLKHITYKEAEFAIVIRNKAMGKGISQYGMSEILRIGFQQLSLKKIYWCVSPENQRAIRFYDKNGYPRADFIKSGLADRIKKLDSYDKRQAKSYIWYEVENERL